MDLPKVLIVSTEIGKASSLVQEMDGKLFMDNNDVKYFSWDINNKYYSAQILLCVTERIPPEIPADSIEAVILHYESKGEEPLILDKYVPFIQTLNEAEIFLLACEPIDDSQKKEEVTEWCYTHKFELVDMKVPEATSEMDDDGAHEKYGLERLIEALHTHTWPNRILKGIPNGRISTSNEPDVNEIKEQLDNIQLNSARDGTDFSLVDRALLDGILGDTNADFGELLSQLMAMKEHVATLEPSNRRVAAEQLVTAFWKAMGGDSSEIEDPNE
ncbi:alpha- and gamma-adaptin-binding protein p34-like [Chelonus insularis]|uniref:alpha- and gamma-adaptin-binding protein p34-like n=1 Tax=Chelonus insularis TaxID=460826 RepID=UPI00158E8958|nr:alpha- and gamma-adaptin-binding protein p34-like [Chelonus insularis]